MYLRQISYLICVLCLITACGADEGRARWRPPRSDTPAATVTATDLRVAQPDASAETRPVDVSDSPVTAATTSAGGARSAASRSRGERRERGRRKRHIDPPRQHKQREQHEQHDPGVDVGPSMLLAGVGVAIVGSLAALMSEVAEVADAGGGVRSVVNESLGVIVEGPQGQRFLLQAPNENLYLSRCPRAEVLLSQAAYGRGLMQALALRVRGMDGDDPSMPHARWWADPSRAAVAMTELVSGASGHSIPPSMTPWVKWAWETDQQARTVRASRSSQLSPAPMLDWLEVLTTRCGRRLPQPLALVARDMASRVLDLQSLGQGMEIKYEPALKLLEIRVAYDRRDLPGGSSHEPRKFRFPGSEHALRALLEAYGGTGGLEGGDETWALIDMAAHRMARLAGLYPAILGAVMQDHRGELGRFGPGSWTTLVMGILRDALISAGRHRISAMTPPEYL